MSDVSNPPSILSNFTLGQLDFTLDCKGVVKIYAPLRTVTDLFSAYLPIREIYAEAHNDDPFPYDDFITVLRSIAPTPFNNASRGAIVN